MGSYAKHMILCHTNITTTSSNIRNNNNNHSQFKFQQQKLHVSSSEESAKTINESGRRWTIMSIVGTTSTVLGLGGVLGQQHAAAVEPVEWTQSWGTTSFFKEKYLKPGLTPEEAVARIKQTTEGLKEMRKMLETMSWRYVLYYVRLKSAYLDTDLKNALYTVPEGRRKDYVKVANDVVSNMAQLDRHVRSPKVYESYVYYEKTLKSLDELIVFLA